jgi:hypothetical protein
MRREISAEKWEQARTAYASGIPLRDLARRMGIPEGSMLAHASRKHWTQRIEAAKSMAKSVESAIVPACDAAAQTMQARAERHVERMARVTDKVLPHLEQWSRPNFSTPRATWSDSITSPGAIMGWTISRTEAVR